MPITRTGVYNRIYFTHKDFYLRTSEFPNKPETIDKASREANIVAVQTTEGVYQNMITGTLYSQERYRQEYLEGFTYD